MLHADRFRHALFPRQLLHAIPFPPSLLVTGHLYGADGTWCRRSLAKPRRSAPQRRLLRFFWREVRLRVDGRFLSSRRPVPASRRKCSRSRVRGCLAVSRCGSGAAGGKILKPILAISVSFFIFVCRKCVTGALRYLVFSYPRRLTCVCACCSLSLLLVVYF